MSNYKLGRIYRINHNQSNICYIGSTFNTLRDRWYNHKSSYNRYLNKEENLISIYPYFKEFGIQNFKIILIKEYIVIDKNQLKAYEQLWINKLKSINTQSSFSIKYLSRKKFRTDNKEKISKQLKQYRENNKKKISKQKKEYYENNKETLLEQKKEYYENNKEKISEQNKQYRKDNKEKIKEQKKAYAENNKDKKKEYDKLNYQKNKTKKLEYQKNYAKENKDKIKEYKKDYADKNKEMISKKNKEKYEKNKEKISEYSKEYREKNKEKIKEQKKIKKFCEICNIDINKDNFNRHLQTKKHLDNLKKLK